MTQLKKILFAAFISVGVCISAIAVYANTFEAYEAGVSQSKRGPMHFDQGKYAENIAQRQVQPPDQLGLTADQKSHLECLYQQHEATSYAGKPHGCRPQNSVGRGRIFQANS